MMEMEMENDSIWMDGWKEGNSLNTIIILIAFPFFSI